MLGSGVFCLLAAAVSAAFFLRAPGAEPRLVLSLLLGVAGVVSLARWNGFRGRVFFRCDSCGRIWARRSAQ
jgi:hypothetical protein